jgi:GT2 family glycosyltransferase
MTKAAILIPSYNSSATIEETLSSIRNAAGAAEQTIAIYLADDGSTDSTIELAKNSWTNNPPLRVLSQPSNLGEYANVNCAFNRLAQDGIEWVLILHSDDIARPDWLLTMLERIERCAAEVATICSSWDSLRPDGKIVPGEDMPSRPVELIKGDAASVRGTLLNGCWWHISGAAIRMKAFEALGGLHPHLRQRGDWEWLLRCLKNGWAVEYVARTLILYREHAASVSSKSFREYRDVRESLGIIAEYGKVLSSLDCLRLRWQSFEMVTRRAVAALVHWESQKFWRGVQTLLLVLAPWKKRSDLSTCATRRCKSG